MRDYVRVQRWSVGFGRSSEIIGPVHREWWLPDVDAYGHPEVVVRVEPTGELLVVGLHQFVEDPAEIQALTYEVKKELKDRASTDPNVRRAVIDLGTKWAAEPPPGPPLQGSIK